MGLRHSAAPRSADPRLRGALLMPLCALAVHQLRYALAFGVHTPSPLARDGHAYLGTLEPLILLAAALAVGTMLGQTTRRWHRIATVPPRRSRTPRVWALCTVGLVAIYCVQELVEGMLASGHASGLAGIVGHGGWIAVPVAVVIGGALAAALRIADALLSWALARAERPRRPAPGARPRPLAARRDWRLAALSGAIAGRAPPVRGRP